MSFDCLNIDSIIGFDWDNGNILKNEIKHGLKWQIIEEVFFNDPLILLEDTLHSSNEECRCAALGFTNEKRLISVIFTKRSHKIRVISARPMSQKERSFYENFTKI
ncbi:MAG: BrnT family toxin [Epsilonproteobacteria bacterium]|nr:BrnT family toxin [Campylobacterota bacterium]